MKAEFSNLLGSTACSLSSFVRFLKEVDFMSAFEEKKKQRFLFMEHLYKEASGKQNAFFEMYELGQEIGFTEAQTDLVVQYLADENLLESMIGGMVRITHDGVRQVEKSFSKPEEPTLYFPPVNIINVKKMSHSVVQQATHDSMQTVSFLSDNVSNTQHFLRQLKSELPQLNLPEQARIHAEKQIVTIEMQLTNPAPNTNLIKTARDILYGILLGVGGNFATDLLKNLAWLG